jgi:MFS family permease
VVSALLTVVLAISLIWLIQTWLIWPAVVLLSTSAFGVYIVSLAIMGDAFKGADLVSGSAAFAMMWGIGGLAGPPIAGVMIDAFGINAMPVTLASFYVLLLIGLGLTRGQLVRAR